MTTIDLKHLSRWLPATLVAVVVLLAGARLITLSMRDHAAQMHSAAQSTVTRETRLIEAQLQALTDRTRDEARRAARALGQGTTPAAGAGPGRGAFWMTADGTVARAGDADTAVSRALANEWAVTAARARAPTGILGPVRYGSQWIIAAYAPIEAPQAKAAAASPAWAVGYQSLDALLVRAGFGRVVKDGFAFQINQTDPLTHGVRELFGSRPDMPSDAVASAIRAPAAFSPPNASAYLQLALRPRTGWYPTGDLVSRTGLLLLLAWALVFGAHELTASLGRTQSALAQARKRLHAVNDRLGAEIEQHQALQRSLEHARYHDPFTGLPNRRYFMDQLDRALRELRNRRRQRIAIVLIDIDRFTLINDTLGHTAGDELMLQVAQRFAKALEGVECVLARWGSEQLAVLVHEVQSPAAVHAITTELQNARQEPFALRQHRVKIATRVGFTCIDSGLQRAEDALREADVALSVAKRQQNQLTVAYTPGMAAPP